MIFKIVEIKKNKKNRWVLGRRVRWESISTVRLMDNDRLGCERSNRPAPPIWRNKTIPFCFRVLIRPFAAFVVSNSIPSHFFFSFPTRIYRLMRINHAMLINVTEFPFPFALYTLTPNNFLFSILNLIPSISPSLIRVSFRFTPAA